MAKRNTYTIHYILGWSAADEKMVDVIASNKEDAYDKAVFEVIPELEGTYPYGAWVSSVTYNNGRCHYFNTSCGNAY